MLKVDRVKQKLYLIMFDKYMNLIGDDVYWTFGTLRKKSYRKLKIVGFIDAKRKYVNNK